MEIVGLNKYYVSVERQPREISLVTLPKIALNGRQIRLGMHTDTIGNLLRTLSTQPEIDQLQVQARCLTPDQWSNLRVHPVYRFFMNGRLARVRSERQEEIVTYLVPKDLIIDQDQSSDLLELAFSPETLADELGFKVGFIQARELIESWQVSGNPNDLLPLLGGCNEFKLGSDSLDATKLALICEQIAARLKQLDQHYLNQGTTGQVSSLNIPYIQKNLFSGQFNALSINSKKDDSLLASSLNSISFFNKSSNNLSLNNYPKKEKYDNLDSLFRKNDLYFNNKIIKNKLF